MSDFVASFADIWSMRASNAISNALVTLKDYVARGYRLFFNGQFLMSAQAVAFKVLITWVPLALLATGAVALLLAEERPYQVVQDFLSNYFPNYERDRLSGFIRELQRVSGALTIVGMVTLLYTTLTLFSTLRVAVSNVFREDWHRVRRWSPGLAFDFRMMLQLGALFLATVALSIAAQFLDGSGIELMRRVGISAPWMLTGWANVAHFLTLFVPVILSVGMFYQLYYFIPLPHPPRKSALIGAVFAAILWEIGKYFFTNYTTGASRYDTWVMFVESDRIAMLTDAFGLIVAFVLWAYYSGVILMMGGTVALIHETRARERAEAEEAAASAT